MSFSPQKVSDIQNFTAENYNELCTHIWKDFEFTASAITKLYKSKTSNLTDCSFMMNTLLQLDRFYKTSKYAIDSARAKGLTRGLSLRRKQLRKSFSCYPNTVKELPLNIFLQKCVDIPHKKEACRKRSSIVLKELEISPSKSRRAILRPKPSMSFNEVFEPRPRKRKCVLNSPTSMMPKSLSNHIPSSNLDFSIFMDAVKLSNLINPLSNVKLETEQEVEKISD